MRSLSAISDQIVKLPAMFKYSSFAVIACSLALCGALHSQTNVNLLISFDDYVSEAENELTRNFTVSDSAFTAIPSGGLVGGAIKPKNSQSLINTRAQFRARFANAPGRIAIASIDFHFSQGLVNPNQKEPPAGIIFRPSSDGNRYVIAMLEHEQGASSFRLRWMRLLGVQSLDNQTAPAPSPLVQLANGWYRLQLTATIIGGQFGDHVVLRSEVFSLGSDGLESASLVAESDGVIFDSVFAGDQVFVSILGAEWGGTAAADNFRFVGVTNDPIEQADRRFEATISPALKVSWNSLLGKTYSVEWSPDLTAQSWSILAAGLQGNGSTMHVFDELGVFTQKFYRVREQ